MPKTLYNLYPETVWVNVNEPATPPGGAREFSDDELFEDVTDDEGNVTKVARAISGNWSETNPRSGLEAEIDFKAQRDGGATPVAGVTEPAATVVTVPPAVVVVPPAVVPPATTDPAPPAV